MMKASEMRKMAQKDLEKELTETAKEQFNLQMQKGSEHLAKPHLLRQARRKVARLKTIISEMKKGSKA